MAWRILIFAVTVTGAFAIQPSPSVKSGQPLRVAYSHFPPYSIIQADGSPGGFSHDLIREAGRRTGLRMQWIRSETETFEKLRDGQFDLWPMMALLPEREGKVGMSEPWWENSLVLVSPAARPIREERDTRGKRIALVHFSFGLQRVKKLFPQAIPHGTKDYREVAASVCGGAADGGVLEARLAAALPLLEACKDKLLTLDWVKELNISYVIGARRGMEPAARQLFEELMRMSRDGTMTRLGAPWGLAAPNQYESLERLARAEQQKKGLWWTITAAAAVLLLLAGAAWRLLRAERTAREALEARSRFMANVSHEIRTPLHGIIGTAELMARQGVPAQLRDNVETIQDCGQMLLRQINDLLDLAKLEAGRMEIESLATSPEALILATMEAFQPQARAKQIRLTVAAECPPWVMADPTRIKQVLFNLTSNAIKFTARGDVRLTAQVTGQGRLRFSVRDSGPGIAPEIQAKLFAPFTQGDESVARVHGGTGLGLAICRELARAMSGELGVDSKPGSGAEFWLDVPCRPAPAPQAEKRALASMSQRRVLVVEDNPVNRRIAQSSLEALGCAVHVADGGESALDLLDRHPVDLVLMDCHMPGLDGFETTRRIRQSSARHVPIVALTAAVFEEDRRAATDAGMDGLLPKPFALDQLRDALERYAPSYAGESVPSLDSASG